VLLFAASELEYRFRADFGLSPAAAGILGGMGGGIAQAYSTMGFCTVSRMTWFSFAPQKSALPHSVPRLPKTLILTI
jgi:hypothetical protein